MKNVNKSHRAFLRAAGGLETKSFELKKKKRRQYESRKKRRKNVVQKFLLVSMLLKRVLK